MLNIPAFSAATLLNSTGADVLDAEIVTQPITGPYSVDALRGQRDGALSSQWFSRPDDQRYLSLNDLATAVRRRRDFAVEQTIDASEIIVHSGNGPDLFVSDSNAKQLLDPTHWSFGQLCALGRAPAGYLRQLPSQLAAINLQYGLQGARDSGTKLYSLDNKILAATGPDYGRIYDIDVVNAVQKIAGNGTGDTRWKVPGTIDWMAKQYNPFVSITTETTTLYASDRDVYIMLVDDTHPIKVGTLENGEPDYLFPGFIVSNSEVGAGVLELSMFYMRGVCANRNIWGQEKKFTLRMRHSKYAPERFIREAAPKLLEFTNASTAGVIRAVDIAKSTNVIDSKADDAQEKRLAFLQRFGFGKKESATIVQIGEQEDGHRPTSAWDMIQAITAAARRQGHQDERLEMERKAGSIMDKFARV